MVLLNLHLTSGLLFNGLLILRAHHFLQPSLVEKLIYPGRLCSICSGYRPTDLPTDPSHTEDEIRAV